MPEPGQTTSTTPTAATNQAPADAVAPVLPVQAAEVFQDIPHEEPARIAGLKVVDPAAQQTVASDAVVSENTEDSTQETETPSEAPAVEAVPSSAPPTRGEVNEPMANEQGGTAEIVHPISATPLHTEPVDSSAPAVSAPVPVVPQPDAAPAAAPQSVRASAAPQPVVEPTPAAEPVSTTPAPAAATQPVQAPAAPATPIAVPQAETPLSPSPERGEEKVVVAQTPTDSPRLQAAGAPAPVAATADPLDVPAPQTTPAAPAGPAPAAPAEDAAPAKKPGLFDSLFGSTKKKPAAKAVAQKPADAKKKEAAKKQPQISAHNAEKIYQQGLASVKDLIAPSSMEILFDRINLSGRFCRSFFVFAYPRFLETNWMNAVVNFDATFDVAQFVYPISSNEIMKTLQRKVAQIQSSINMAREKGMVRDPELETALEDAEQLRTDLQRGQEKFFQFGMYITVYAEDEKKLESVTKQMESMLGGQLILTKRADIQSEHALNSTLPMCLDEIEIQRNMNTSPLSTTFPFISSELTSDDGILYGLNRHNDSLVIFDRFKLPNANSVVFASSGAGKSYGVKLEVLRQMMLGTDVIILDPENEYEDLTAAVGGTYLKVSLNSPQRINPFDLPLPIEGNDEDGADILRSNIITLTSLMKLMLGQMTADQEALIDKALMDTYAMKGITMDTENPGQKEPPTMEDFHSVLSSMQGAEELAVRLQKYTTGTFGGIFNKPTNIDLNAGLVCFCIRDLEDALRPIAMFIILNYIWARVRSQLKRRMLVVDEAWTMMQHEDAAKFMFGLVKRARKYYLGVTAITQDVEDFIKSPYGKPIVTNASMALLMKQAASSIDALTAAFNLTEGEKYMLLNSGVGQGLFFADRQHVALQIIASYAEHQLVTTNPEEKLQKEG